MPGLIFSLVLFFSMLSYKAIADEESTTWRAGDLIRYRTACHTAEDIMKIGNSTTPNETAGPLMRENKCFVLIRPARAILEEWVGGHYRMPEGVTASAWRLKDQFGDIEFSLIRDFGGPHMALEEAS